MTAPVSTPPSDAEQPLLDLDGLVAGIRWRRRMWTIFALVGLLLGVAASTVLPSRASADASIYVIHENEGSGDGQSLMKTDLALLQTTTVAAAAVAALNLDTTPEKYLTTYSGAVAADNILTVTVRAADDAQAVAGAQAVADAFVTVHVKQSTDAANATVTAYNDRQDQVQRDLDDVNKQIAAVDGPTPAALQTLYNRRASLASQISNLQQQAQAASIGSPQVAAGTKIIDAPHRTSRSLLVSVALYGAIGLGLGLAIGLVFAAVAAVARNRPVLRRDIAQHLGASVIAQIPAPLRGPLRFVRRSYAEKERRRAATTLARVVKDGSRPVSVLELGCASVAAQLVKDMAEELAVDRSVTVVDDLPGDEMAMAMAESPESPVELIPGADFPSAVVPPGGGKASRLSIATVGPGSPWPDLRRLGNESLLVVRAGSADSTWLHTVARQLADSEIMIIGVVVVHPDPRDRSDGTLWDATHMALRGRVAPGPVPVSVAAHPGAPVPAPVRAVATAARPHGRVAPTGPLVPAPRRPSPRPQPLPPAAPHDGGRPAPQVTGPGPAAAPPTTTLPITALPTTALPAVAASVPAPDAAGPDAPVSGAAANGAAANGAAANGAAANGAAANGAAANGPATNGPATNGPATDGAAANGAATDGAAATNGAATDGAAATKGAATDGAAATKGAAANKGAAAANGAAAKGAATTNGAQVNGVPAEAPTPSGGTADAAASGSAAGEGVRGTNGSTAGRKPSPRPHNGRRPAPRLNKGTDPAKPRPRPGGLDVQATDKFKPVVPSTPADHVEAT